MSLLDAKASNTVLTECNKVQNSQGDSLSQSMPASESAECEPQTDCNSFYGDDANENTASRVNSPLPAQQEEVLEDEVAGNTTGIYYHGYINVSKHIIDLIVS